MTPRRWWRWVFLSGALVFLGALYWVSSEVLRMERAEVVSLARAEFQETMRMALWRMDARLAPLLVRESSRPYFEYLMTYPSHRAYRRFLGPIGRNERNSSGVTSSSFFPENTHPKVRSALE